MSREIKFRAWHKLENRFIDLNGLSIWFGGHPDKGQVYAITEQGCIREYPLAEIDLTQYTGLKDKNGKEVYEGDIVRMKTDISAKANTVIWEERYSHFTTSNSPSWSLGIYMPPLFNKNTIEVVGNIYEHPELIKAA